MKNGLALAVFLLCLSPAAFGQLVPSLNASAYRALCRVDDEIPQADRSLAEAVALDLAQNAMSGNGNQAYHYFGRFFGDIRLRQCGQCVGGGRARAVRMA